MLGDLAALLWAPFLMCLVLTGIHAYLGVHVLAREVVFVDIAMAQIAALGATAAFLFHYELDTWQSYFAGLAATLVGALVLALTRSRRRRVSQEAIVGIVYAVSAAGAVLLADRAPHGAEQVRTMIVGNLLAVRPREVVEVGVLYALVGLLHWLCRRPFFLISTDPRAAFEQGWRVRAWDLLFYASFGVVVTSSVRIAGVLLVFSYLIVPALAGVLLGGSLRARLAIGWGFGTLVSVIGMIASAALDLPTGATVVCAFGATLIAFWIVTRGALWRRARTLTVLAVLALFAVQGCASVTRVTEVRQVVGVWEGWLVGPNDARPAVLAIREDRTFDLDARLISVTGVLKLADGALGFEGGGPWHGTLALSGDSGRRTLRLERADRGFRGRFTLKGD
jgi:zinc/manganese transport system permease protein